MTREISIRAVQVSVLAWNQNIVPRRRKPHVRLPLLVRPDGAGVLLVQRDQVGVEPDSQQCLTLLPQGELPK